MFRSKHKESKTQTGHLKTCAGFGYCNIKYGISHLRLMLSDKWSTNTIGCWWYATNDPQIPLVVGDMWQMLRKYHWSSATCDKCSAKTIGRRRHVTNAPQRLLVVGDTWQTLRKDYWSSLTMTNAPQIPLVVGDTWQMLRKYHWLLVTRVKCSGLFAPQTPFVVEISV